MRGATLIELLMVLTILGLMAAVVGFGAPHDAWVAVGPQETDALSQDRQAIATARRRALESGKSAKVFVEFAGVRVPVLALPDGRVVGAQHLGYDPLSGRPVVTPSP